MCVLICRAGPQPLLAANRDEHFARPFSSPRPWVAATPFWAPRDEEEGGTWIGVNRNGLMAAITNRSRLEAKPGRSSRGGLVTGLLARSDLGAALAWLRERLDAEQYNPCQFWIAQGAESHHCQVGENSWSVDSVSPGLHVFSNLHDPGEIDFGLAPDAGWEEISEILADRSPRLPRGFAVCKDAGWRGTVASALIEPGKRFLFADGPPDRVAYAPVSGYPD